MCQKSVELKVDTKGNDMEDKANILVVDDELGPRESLRMILKPFSNVHTVENGQLALDFIKQKPVNLVTLDLKMPGLGGVEVLKGIKNHNPEIEVIILTGFGSLDTAAEAVRQGALDYITKPFDVDRVENVVRKGLEKHKFNVLSGQLARSLDVPERAADDAGKENVEPLEDRLLCAEKLAILGQLAPKIAHEINNSLQVVQVRADQGLRKSKQGDLFNKYFDNISIGARKIDHIAQQLMTYGKPSGHKEEMISIQDVLEDCVRLLTEFGEIKRCEIHRFYRDGVPLIMADKFELEHLFINLIMNASHAMEGAEENKLVIETYLNPDGDFVEISISDTGFGIPEENVKKIFTPFFTTKRGNGGSGLGLSIVKNIVDRHHGRIDVQSETERGTTFRVSLPVNTETRNLERCK